MGNTTLAIVRPEVIEKLHQPATFWAIAVVAVIAAFSVGYMAARGKRPQTPTPDDANAPAEPRRKFLNDVDLGRLGLLLLGAATLLLVSEVLTEGFFGTAAHEVGFAILVSAVIWVMFESQLRQEADATWDRRIEQATRNVFQAVLRKDLPKGLLDEANNLVLNSSLVRTDFSVTYTLRDETFDVGDGTVADCVLVDSIMEFGMQNVSTASVQWRAGLNLPNPVHPNLKKLVKVHSFVVRKGAEAVQFDMDAGEAAFRAAIADDQLTAVGFDAGTVTLKPGDVCTCATRYTMAKETEDSEVLQTLHPADGLRVTIFDQAIDTRRVLFARAIHRETLESESNGNPGSSARIFRIPGYLLPHQGVLIWWKRNPGSVDGSLPVQTGGDRTEKTKEKSDG